MYKGILFNLILITTFLAKSQGVERFYYGGLLYKTSGWGICYQNKVSTTKTLDKQIDFEFTSFKNPTEVKSFNTEVNSPTAYVFGKLNKVALLKAHYSLSKNIAYFTDAQRIGVDVIAGGGLTFGFIKPVYLNIIYPDAYGFEAIVSEKYDPEKHTDRSRIAGYTDGRVGMDEINVKTGISVSAGIGFTWGYFTNFPKRIETGFYLEYFKNGLPVMAFVKNKSLNNGVYLRFLIGKSGAKN